MGSGKTCKVCGEWKLLDAFNTKLLSRDGRRSDCKECQAQYNRQYRVVHSEAQKDYRRQYDAEHAEERRQYDRRRSNNEERKAYQREYRAKHADKLKEYVSSL